MLRQVSLKRFAPNFLLFCLLTVATTVCSQKIDSLLQILDSRYPQEKAYLHFDKSYYNPGETIWFKAYLFAGTLPSEISKTLYAELIDDKGKLIERRTAPIAMGSAAAAFDLSPSLKSSTVYIRAYTDWMLNFDTSFLYQRAIPVVQPKTTQKSSTPAPKSFLQFFPESGDLVVGVQSRVAFKATDVHGLPFNVKGTVVDASGKTVTAFANAHDGMGYFLLTPASDAKYKAIWKDASGKTQQTAIPTALKEGIVLQTEQDTDKIRFAITRQDDATTADEKVSLVGQMQQQLVYLAKADISKSKTISSSIPTTDIPAGILQLTVIKDNKPVAERLIFVNKQDYYFITDLNSPLKGFDKRKRNVIQVDVPDTIKTNLSISITDATVNPRQEGEEDIFSGTLLTADIKGYVHNPGYYFSSEVDSVQRHLDLIMMTNGWRRFKWESVLAGKWPAITHIPEDYISVNGKINGLTRAQLSQQEITGIFEIDKKQQFMSIPVDVAGTFKLTDLIFYDTAKLFYQLNKDKDKVLTSKASFDIKNNFFKTALPFKADTLAPFRFRMPGDDALAQNNQLSSRYLTAMTERRKVQMLESVTITAKAKSKKDLMEDQYTSGLFKGGDGYTFITEDDPFANSAYSVLNYLQGKVAGLQISGSGSQMSMSWRGGTPSLFLDEMQTDLSQVQSIPMTDVAMIKVFRPPFMGATGGGAGGAIAIYSKKGAAANQNVKGLDFVKIPGYSPVRQFYSPDYAKYDESNTQGDFRSTLYWNPFLLTDKDTRRVVFSFYNNDVTKRFRVVIEGCNAEGKLTRIEKIFQ